MLDDQDVSSSIFTAPLSQLIINLKKKENRKLKISYSYYKKKFNYYPHTMNLQWSVLFDNDVNIGLSDP